MEGPNVVESQGVGASFCCDLCDREVVRKIAEVLLQGLATGCVDNTTGDLFRGPASVAVEVRKEMVEYLIQRSQSYLAESVAQEGGAEAVAEILDHPTEIVLELAEEFAATKSNLLGRVSGWMLSESREDKIDDLVQEMEINGFWLTVRREAVAEELLRHVDFKNAYHCTVTFEDPGRLEEHRREECGFRPVSCGNEGCKASFCAANGDEHDAACPFKVLPCEQNCSMMVVRREMDRHCVTVCPMRVISCPFHHVGCGAAVPQGAVAQHCAEFLHFHVLQVLQAIRKEDVATDEIKEHAILLQKCCSDELCEARDVRSLTSAIKRQEGRMKNLEEPKETSPNT